MKTTILTLPAAILVAASLQTHAQGTLVYDQQSATNPVAVVGNGNADGLYIQPEPLTQSFIPTLSAIDFVQFEFEDVPPTGANGATVYVNLWTGSPNTNSATFVSSTTPVFMPSGFVNNNLFVAGITNFLFSTPITLTPGQTYYLQPVVQSGDNPWVITTIGNTYPNGQLYGSGAFFQPSTDLWFREGIDSVPEPTALALIGLSSLLVFGFRRRSKLLVLFGVGVLFLGSARAQMLSLQPASGDSVVQIVADEAGLQPVSAAGLPRGATYWVVASGANGNVTALPYPCLPPALANSAIYAVAPGRFLVDASGQVSASFSGRRMSSAMMASTLQAEADTVAGLIANMQDDSLPPGANGRAGFYSDSFTPLIFTTNNLWLEITGKTNTTAYLTIHPPWNVINGVYDLYYTTDLSSPEQWSWVLRSFAGQTNLAVNNATDAQGFYWLGPPNDLAANDSLGTNF